MTIRSSRSDGTHRGMIFYYRRRVPMCKLCKSVYLTQHKYRKVGLCAGCCRLKGVKVDG